MMIVGGLYWVTALRKTGGEVKAYTRHRRQRLRTFQLWPRRTSNFILVKTLRHPPTYRPRRPPHPRRARAWGWSFFFSLVFVVVLVRHWHPRMRGWLHFLPALLSARARPFVVRVGGSVVKPAVRRAVHHARCCMTTQAYRQPTQSHRRAKGWTQASRSTAHILNRSVAHLNRI